MFKTTRRKLSCQLSTGNSIVLQLNCLLCQIECLIASLNCFEWSALIEFFYLPVNVVFLSLSLRQLIE